MYKLLLFIALALASHGWSQDSHPLYKSGQFPAGAVYTEQTILSLIDQTIPNPSYLVGRFVYLDKRQGEYVFMTFGPGLTGSTNIAFGQMVIAVRFFDNAPELALGKMIVPDSNDPLTIRAVTRSQDGKCVLVAAESWSAK